MLAAIVRLISFVTLIAISIEAQAQVEMYLFDFDGTLVEHRQSREGAFNSKVIIFRNDLRLNLLQTQPSGPKNLIITQQDLHKISEYLGTPDGLPGAVNREVELQSGARVRPGEYYLRYPDSYEFFREAPTGQNYLLEAFMEAEARSPEGRWKGAMWDLFQELCSTELGATKASIITARGHSRAEWAALFDYMQKQGHIKFKPDVRRVFNVSRPEFDRYGSGGAAKGGDPTDVAIRKAAVVEEILLSLSRVEAPPGRLHSVMVADDEVRNLERIASVFQKIAFGNHVRVRMTLASLALKSEIRVSPRPEFAVIEPASSIFKSVPRENLFSLIRPPGVIRTCEGLFKSTALAQP